MNKLVTLVALLGSALAVPAARAEFNYEFAGAHTAAFSVSELLVADTTLSGSVLKHCSTFNYDCTELQFVLDAAAAGLTGDAGVSAMGFGGYDGDGVWNVAWSYYQASSFVQLGSYQSLYGFNPTSMTVSAVPEPATLALLLVGCPAVAAAARRRQLRELR